MMQLNPQSKLWKALEGWKNNNGSSRFIGVYDNGKLRSLSWREFFNLCVNYSRMMPSGIACMDADNSPESFAMWMAALFCGTDIISVGRDISHDILSEFLKAYNISVVFATNKERLRYLQSFRNESEWMSDGENREESPSHVSTLTLLELGRHTKTNKVVLDEEILLSQARNLCDFISLSSDDCIVYAMESRDAKAFATFAAAVYRGCEFIVVNRGDLSEALPAIDGSVVFSIPSRFEQLWRSVVDDKSQSSFLGRSATKLRCATCLQSAKNNSLSKALSAAKPLLEKVVTVPLRHKIGDGYRAFVSGGANLHTKSAHFFHLLSIDIFNTYSFSQIGGFAHIKLYASALGDFFESIDYKIVLGKLYIKSKYAEEWCDTGDYAFDDDKLGLCVQASHKITIKDGTIVETATIAEKIRRLPLVREVFVFGEDEDFLCALLYLNPTALKIHFQLRGAKRSDFKFEEQCQNPKTYRHLQEKIEQINLSSPQKTHIRKFAIIPKPIDDDYLVLTETGHTRAWLVRERYASIIRSFYEKSY